MEYDEDEFENIGRVHDWRNYISEDMIAIWHTFTDEQRKVIYENAEQIAFHEDWD